jgi:hypothetical protein
MSYRCQRCDEELTYALGSTDFECGLLCDQCRGRYDRFDDCRVWQENKRRRETYLEKWSREFIDKTVDELFDEVSEYCPEG